MDKSQASDGNGHHSVLPAVSQCLQEILATIDSEERAVSAATLCKDDDEASQSVANEDGRPASPIHCTLAPDENGHHSILPAVSQCLQEILATIDSEERAVSAATRRKGDDESSQSVANEEGRRASPTPPKRSGGLKSAHPAEGQPTDFSLRSFLPHEGPRWVCLRDKVLALPQFQRYAKRVAEASPWSLDEAFMSFCLDRLEESLVFTLPETNHQKPAFVQKTKKATRRKGQPRKYERTQDDKVSSIQPSEDYVDAFYIDEMFDEEDMLSMDDNPSDLDYEPVSIIRYKKTPSRRMPRRTSTRRSRDDAMVTVSMEMVDDTADTSGVVEVKPKQAKPKKKSPNPRASLPKTAAEQPSRKRGRPKKNPADPPKVPGKKGRPPMTEEQRIAKRKAYNDSRTRTRLEVVRDALPKILRCKACPEQFTDNNAMLVHHLEVHQQRPVGASDRQDPASAYNTTQMRDVASVLLECPKCKEYVENLTRHNRQHQTRNFICEECGKFFVTRMRLKLHMRIHTMDRTGERLHCDQCDKSYRCLSSLQRHQLIHGGKKTFICDQCGKDFFNSVRLRVHRAVHMKEKPYPCPECGRGFTQLTNLRSHQRVHTGVKPYRCELCQDSFTHKVSLKMHQKKKHGIDWWKENGIQLEERKPSRKKAAQKRGVARGTAEKEWAFVDQQQGHVDEAVRNYEFVSNLITHGSKTYAQLERKSSVGEAFRTAMNPFENQWHS